MTLVQWQRALALLLLLPVAALIGCGGGGDPTKPITIDPLGKEDKIPDGPPFFKELSPSETGVSFTYRNGEKKEHLSILESLGGGVGLIDFDRDGLMDLICVGGGDYKESRAELEKAKKTSTEIYGYPCKLYRNKSNFQFEDVTDKALKRSEPWFYSHACAVADYDLDGWPDLVITGYRGIALFHNEPVVPKDPSKGRQLVDVTKKSGIQLKDKWSSSAGWADLDGDNYPELYICNYADWSWKKHPKCDYDGSTADVCPPKSFSGQVDTLLQNNRNGTFTDVSDTLTLLKRVKDEKTGERKLVPESKGLRRGGPESSKGLGVIIVDVTMDGKPDIYVANDTVDNFLYINHCKPGEFAFHEVGLQVGVARDGRGTPNGSMGLAVGDYDGRGLPSLFVTNYEGEMHALYHNVRQKGQNGKPNLFYFGYKTAPSGIASIGQNYVAWGAAFIDVENRGKLDILFVNGHAIRFPKKLNSSREQTPILFRNIGEGKFKNYTPRGGEYFKARHLSRGLAVGDLNNDGLQDMVVCQTNAPVSILKNVSPAKNHWLGIQLDGFGNSESVGAKIILEVDGEKQYRFQFGGGSYASAPGKRHVFGLGDKTKIDKLTVIWPKGWKQEWKNLTVDQYHVLKEKPPTD